MSADKKCKCPLCDQNFTPADGVTDVEHLACDECGMKEAVQAFNSAPLPKLIGGLYRKSFR